MKHLFLLLVLLISCGKEDQELANGSNNSSLNASMEVLLIDCKDPFCSNFDPIADILIQIYEDPQNQKDNLNAVAEGYTNQEGKLNFPAVNHELIYVSTYYNNEIIFTIESILPNTHSFHRIEL